MEAMMSRGALSSEQRERLFFLVMAIAIVSIVAVAFGFFYQAGLSSFGAPWWVHVHALTFVVWIAFYLNQNLLVYRNNLSLHRKLGRIGAVYAIWMILVGTVLTPMTLAAGRSPPFFTPAYFLALDWVNILVFGGLFYAAIHNRKRTDWHRRLMLCATVSVIAPAWGRLIILSGVQITAWNTVAALLASITIAMLFDWFNRGRVHAAYAWGFGIIFAMAVAIEGLATLPPFISLADSIAA